MLNENVVVIGSNSFSGAHFVNHALSEGARVIGISRSPEASPVFLPFRNQDNSRYAFHQLDLNHHLPQIMALIHEFRPDYVVNFAAQSMVGESWQHPEHWFQTNVVATVRFHDQLRSCTFLKKYVHISTPEVYGSCSGTIKEHTNYQPSTPYAVSRAAADMSLLTFHKNYQFPVVFTRAANVYGPCQQLYRIIPRSILYFLLGKKLQLDGGGVSVRSFIHIEDVVRGTMSIARDAAPGEIFHLSTTETISIRQLVEEIAARLGVNFDRCVEIGPERPGKDSAYLLDSSKAAERFQWKPSISLNQGLDQTIAWVKTNLEELKNLPLTYIHKP